MRSPSTRLPDLALALGVIALFVALGGPAYAAGLINGSSIKAGSITASKIADGSVSVANVAKKARTALQAAKGPTGAPGPAGAAGAAGDRGPRGGVGGFDAIDAKGRTVGTALGSFSSFLLVANPQGAVFAYDGSSGTGYPLPIIPPVLYYKTAGCDGQPYTQIGPYPGNWAAMPQSSIPSAGDPAYIQGAGAPESFTYQSIMSGGTCNDGPGATTNMVPAVEAGVVPAVAKPLGVGLRP